MNRVIILVIGSILILANYSRAQFTSTLGEFEVDHIAGCAPLTINTTNLSGDPLAVYWYRGLENRNDDTSPTHTYDTAGTFMLYQVTQVINSAGTRLDSIEINVYEPEPPEYRVFKCSGSAAVVFLTGTRYDQYEIDYDVADPANTPIVVNRGASVPAYTYPAAGTYDIRVRGRYNNALDNCADSVQTVQVVDALTAAQIDSLIVNDPASATVRYSLAPNIRYQLEIAVNNTSNYQRVTDLEPGTGTYTVTGLENDVNTYCFRISTVDVCNAQVISSPIKCTIQLDLQVLNNEIGLEWNTIASGINSFSVYRNGILLVNTPSADRDLIDNFVQCGEDYCYEIVANYASGVSVSATQCGTAFSTDLPAAVPDITVTANGDALEVSFSPPPATNVDTYLVSRGEQGEPLTFLDSLTIPFLEDPGLETGENVYCYSISYEDECGNTAPSASGCSLLLEGRFDPLQNGILTWNEYEGWSSGLDSYIVEVYDASGLLLNTFNVGNNLEFSFLYEDFTSQALQFRVRAVTLATGLPDAVSNVVELIVNPRLSVPDAFTPDGDGLNDTFVFSGQFVSRVETKIFSRWGELIYVSSNINEGWDGTFNGRKVPPGVYMTRIDYWDTLNRKFSRTDKVLLLKD